jgi:hypothetical protein
MPVSTRSFDAEAWVVNKLYDRIHRRNQNVLVGFFGPPRQGKTYSAISLAEQVSEKLGIVPSLDDVTFSVADRYGIDGLMSRFIRQPPRGTPIGLDDAGTAAGANSRKWYSNTNEALSTIGQSAGFLGYLLWVSSPESVALDSQFRSLFHLGFDVKRIDRDRKRVIAKPWVPYRDGKSGKIKEKYPRAVVPGIGPVRVKRVAFRLPKGANGPFDTWPEYEAKKAAFMHPLYRELQRGLENPRRNPAWARKALVLLGEGRTQTELAVQLGISQKAVSELLAQAKADK